MQIDADKLLEESIRDAVRGSFVEKLKGYNSPLDGLLKQAIEKHSGALFSMLSDAVDSFLKDEQMRADIAAAVRQSLAKQLVQKFGGELEKQVNVLKSDPATRARITVAIAEIMKTT